MGMSIKTQNQRRFNVKKIEVITTKKSEMVNITALVQQIVSDLFPPDGTITVFVPHTTCGITITENIDTDVGIDTLAALDAAVPWSQPFYKHNGGNSAAHIKTSMIGNSLSLIVDGGDIQLGIWQGIFLCEFDGPRTRHIWVG